MEFYSLYDKNLCRRQRTYKKITMNENERLQEYALYLFILQTLIQMTTIDFSHTVTAEGQCDQVNRD